MYDELKRKVQTLADIAWERRLVWPDVERWLENFTGEFCSASDERLHALYLLTQSTYFGQELIREMLVAMYNQLFRFPTVHDIRKQNNDTLDPIFIKNEFDKELRATRFLGVGNPSESGSHLLYYFRQVNQLPTDLFINSAEILQYSRDEDSVVSVKQRDPSVKRYIFIDDLLGSGTQIKSYLPDVLDEIRRHSNAKAYYFSLFATSTGLKEARDPMLFNENVACVFELDASFKCFGDESRCFANTTNTITKEVAQRVAEGYGKKLNPGHPMGYKDGQLLLAFFHNTPDNSLPILWFEFPTETAWVPIFKRYSKTY